MGQVSVGTVVAKPRAQVWAQLRDLRMARHYVAGVTSIDFNPGPREGVGASRKVFMQKRAPVDETVIAWEDGVGYTLNLHNGDQPPRPFRWARFEYRMEDAPDGQTLIRGIFSYRMAGGVFGRILEALAVRSALQRSQAALGVNMKKFYETGQVTNSALV